MIRYLIAVAALLLSLSFAAAQSPDAADPAEQKESPGAAEAGEAKIPDLTSLDRRALELLCRNLYQRVEKLEKQVRELRSGNGPDPKAQALIRGLRQQNQALRAQLAQNGQSRVARIRAQRRQQEQLEKQRQEEAAAQAPQYRYRWQTYLIGEKGRADLEIDFKHRRDEEMEIDYEFYRRDAIGLRGWFRNTSSVTRRYQFQAILYCRDAGAAFRRGGPRVAGSAMHSTPYLRPGEIHQFDLAVPVNEEDVDDLDDIGKVDIQGINAYRPPQAEQ